jgi:hypothetical protein
MSCSFTFKSNLDPSSARSLSSRSDRHRPKTLPDRRKNLLFWPQLVDNMIEFDFDMVRCPMIVQNIPDCVEDFDVRKWKHW